MTDPMERHNIETDGPRLSSGALPDELSIFMQQRTSRENRIEREIRNDVKQAEIAMAMLQIAHGGSAA